MKPVLKNIITIVFIMTTTLVCCFVFLKPNKEKIHFDSFVDIIEEKVNWYVEFDKNNNYLMCDNKEFDNKNGICKIGTYKIINGDYFENNTSIELYLDHYYKDGNYITVDIVGPRVVYLERIHKYKNSRVFIDKETNEIFNIISISLEQINYNY